MCHPSQIPEGSYKYLEVKKILLETNYSIVQKVGDRGTDNYSAKRISNCIPANPMSDRGQLLVENKEVKVLGNYMPSGHDASRVVDSGGVSPTVKENHGTVTGVIQTKKVIPETIEIKENNKRGHTTLEIGGVFDGGYLTSKTRRGRVQGGGNIVPSITAETNNTYRLEKCECNQAGAILVHKTDTDEYFLVRIRKLTPKECFRLQGVTDQDADKMLSVNSNSQCYKQAGNSICVPVMEHMFRNLNIKE